MKKSLLEKQQGDLFLESNDNTSMTNNSATSKNKQSYN